MKVLMTVDEIMERGWWSEYCELTHTDHWAVNEGLTDEDREMELPQELVARFVEEEYRKSLEEKV